MLNVIQMSKVTIRETKDVAVIKSVLCNPDIYRCISDDNSPVPDDFEPPLDAEYIAGCVGDDIIGMMIYHERTGRLKCHIQVLPEYRKEYARQFARMALGRAKNATIYAEIPDCFPNVLAFAKSFGFEETGEIRSDYVRDGISHDVITVRLDNGVR